MTRPDNNHPQPKGASPFLYLAVCIIALSALSFAIPCAGQEVQASGSTVSAPAPSLQQEKVFKKSGTLIKMNDRKLSKEETYALLNEYGGYLYEDTWNKGKSLRTAGIITTSAGGTLMLAGLGYTLIYGVAGVFGISIAAIGGQEAAQGVADNFSPHIAGGMTAAVIGTAALGTGVALLIVGNSRMRHIVKDMNAAGAPREIALGIGATKSGGFGLTVDF